MAIPKIKTSSNWQYNTDFWSPQEWQAFGESGGTIDANGNILAGGIKPVMEDGTYGSTFMDAKPGQVLGTLEVAPGTAGMASMKDIATGVNAVTGLANAFLGYKNYGLAKDTFNFNKAAANRDVANQGLAYNTELENRAKIGARLGGLNADQTASKIASLDSKKMNTSAIG